MVCMLKSTIAYDKIFDLTLVRGFKGGYPCREKGCYSTPEGHILFVNSDGKVRCFEVTKGGSIPFTVRMRHGESRVLLN